MNRYACALATVLALSAAWPNSGRADDESTPDNRVELVTKKNGDSVTLSVNLHECTEATITLAAALNNMKASAPLPLTVDARGRTTFEILRLDAVDPDSDWDFTTKFRWLVGARNKLDKAAMAKAARLGYALPYTNETHTVMQGWFGRFSHGKGSQNEYAIDFAMPIGSVVRAARDGTVVAIRTDSSVGGRDAKFKNSANYVAIRHADGTFAEYMHLKHNGALVSLGQRVRVHQALALSGNTGHSSGPHLHFAVFNTIDGLTRQTIPVRFKLSAGRPVELKQGQEY
jgi:murein DD-endopeptidase MepM/ murein hydrolase activator NlpD